MEEFWIDIPGHGGRYEVSTLGRVRLRIGIGFLGGIDRSGYVISQQINSDGYPTVRLRSGNKSSTITVHGLVARAFYGPRPVEQEVRHLDGMKTNNALDNLKYGTRWENTQDTIRHGKLPSAKLTLEQVALIRQIGFNMPAHELASIFGVCKSTIRSVRKGGTWAFVPDVASAKPDALVQWEPLMVEPRPPRPKAPRETVCPVSGARVEYNGRGRPRRYARAVKPPRGTGLTNPEPTTCPVSGLVIPYSGYGRPRRFHPSVPAATRNRFEYLAKIGLQPAPGEQHG